MVCLTSSEQPGYDLDGNVHGARPPHDQPRQAGPHPLRQELRRHHHQRSARNCLQSFWVNRILSIAIPAYNAADPCSFFIFQPLQPFRDQLTATKNNP